MFSFPGKKENNQPVIKDKIWISAANKWEACLQQAKKEASTVFAVWYDATYRQLQKHFSDHGQSTGNIFMTRELTGISIKNKPLIFTEHYPLHTKEEELYEKLGLKEVTVYSSLDEPLFTYFGGEKIIQLVKQLGMKEDEVIEHSLITTSIKNAQEKIYQSVQVEQYAHSQEDWFTKNMESI